MSYKPDTWTCSQCARAKNGDNNWMVAVPMNMAGCHGFAVFQWDADVARIPGTSHLCGPSCAGRFAEDVAHQVIKIAADDQREERRRAETARGEKPKGEPGATKGSK